MSLYFCVLCNYIFVRCHFLCHVSLYLPELLVLYVFFGVVIIALVIALVYVLVR